MVGTLIDIQTFSCSRSDMKQAYRGRQVCQGKKLSMKSSDGEYSYLTQMSFKETFIGFRASLLSFEF